MKLAAFIFLALFFVQTHQVCPEKSNETGVNLVSPTPKKKMKYDRLPPRIKLDTEVRKDTLNEKGEVVSFEVVTVEQRLNELKARYKKGVLVDAKGREIRFFEPLCRGVSAGYERDEQERLEKEKELAELLKKYTVIILYCNPAKIM